VLLDAAELEMRAKQMPSAVPQKYRGYRRLFNEEVLQADEGCDFRSFVPERKKIAPVLA
jgi:dihydroxy-acid dehydratase